MSSAQADPRELQHPGLLVRWDDSQLPASDWAVVAGGPMLVFFYQPGTGTTGGWSLNYDYPFTLSLVAGAPNTGLPAVDLQLQFSPWRMPTPDGLYEVKLWLEPAGLQAESSSLLIAPEGAQFATALRLDHLQIRANGSETGSALSRPLAQNGGVVHRQSLAPGWGTAPGAGGGAWSLSLSQSLIGSYHLLPSEDPGCASLLCMSGQRAAASLQRLDLQMGLGFEIVPLTTVPEPGAAGLLALGLAVLPWLRRRGLAAIEARTGSAS